MFGKKEFDGIEKFDTLIGAITVFEGNLQSEGTIRIDGKIKGDLK
jgi:cytoskeletal protein CcmA (bactofilin family)